MTYEVLVTDPGVATTRDLQGVPTDARALVLLLLRRGRPPLRQRIEIGAIPGGRGVHRGLVCPACETPKYKLFESDSGLGCSTCTRRRSRRQREHKSRTWRLLSGELEDRVLRALRPGRRSSVVAPAVEALAKSLHGDDEQRWAALKARADAAIIAAIAPPVCISEVLEEGS